MAKVSYKYSKAIENKIREGLLKGASIRSIFGACSHYQECPKTYQAFVKKYAKVIDETKLQYQMTILQFANERIADGSDRILELALKSKAGWNPTQVVKEQDPDEGDETDAVAMLKELWERRKKASEKDDTEETPEE